MARRREKLGKALDCPGCGHAVPARAAACGNCGAELEPVAGAPAPSTHLDDFEYDDFLAREFPDTYGRPRSRQTLWIRWVGAVLIAALILVLVFGL